MDGGLVRWQVLADHGAGSRRILGLSLCYNPRVSAIFKTPAAWRWGVALIWCVAVVVSARAQQAADAPAPKGAMSGVYTAAQAERGRELYANICQGCHNIASQTGETFAKRWRGVLLSEMFRLMTEQMPKDDPGSLIPQERADVMAYMLKLNEFPVGTSELPTDPELLKKIVIDLPGGQR